jgi:hypothetical protein
MSQLEQVSLYLSQTAKKQRDFKKTVKKIKQNPKLSIEEKQRKIAQIKGKPGIGITIDQINSEVTGADIKPEESFIALGKKLAKKKNEIYQSLEKGKLDIIFDLEEVKTVIESIDSLKEKLNKVTTTSAQVERDFETIIMGVEKRQQQRDLELQVDDILSNLRKNPANYPVAYADELRPLFKQIRNLKYAGTYITRTPNSSGEGETVHLHQEPWTLQQTIV